MDKAAARLLPPISRIELFLTERCTLSCDYCFVASKSAARRMSWDVARAAVDLLMEQSRGESVLGVTFIGGEPLLEFPLMRRVAEYADRLAASIGKQVEYAVTTNGTRMTREMAMFARKHRFNYLLSIDGVREAHDLHRKTPRGAGSWDRVTGANFDVLKSVQGWVGTRMTVSPDTVGSLCAGVRTLYERGVNHFLIGANEDAVWHEEDLAEWETQMEAVGRFLAAERARGGHLRIAEFDDDASNGVPTFAGVWGCRAGRTTLAVSCSGDLYPCSRFVSSFPGVGDRYRLGTAFEGITNHEARIELLDPAEDRRPQCLACDYRDSCAGPCPAVALHICGDIYTPQALDCIRVRMKAEREAPAAVGTGDGAS